MANPFPLELGQLTIERVTNPGVFSNWSYTPSPRRIEQVISVQFLLTTDANAANRQARILIKDSTGEILRIDNDQVTPASLVETIQYLQGGGGFTQVGTIYAVWPTTIILPIGGTISTSIQFMQAGDEITDIRIVLATWIRT